MIKKIIFTFLILATTGYAVENRPLNPTNLRKKTPTATRNTTTSNSRQQTTTRSQNTNTTRQQQTNATKQNNTTEQKVNIRTKTTAEKKIEQQYISVRNKMMQKNRAMFTENLFKTYDRVVMNYINAKTEQEISNASLAMIRQVQSNPQLFPNVQNEMTFISEIIRLFGGLDTNNTNK